MRYSAFASAALLAGLAGAMPSHAATTMVGQSPAAACTEGARMNMLHNDLADSVKRHAIERCNEALADKISNADRTATLANRGIIETASGDMGAALSDFNEALSRDPQAANVYVNRGVAFLKAGRFEEARADFNHALDMNVGDQARVYFDRGIAEEKLGQVSAAYHDYKLAQSLDPKFAPAAIELARFQVDQRYAAN